MLIMAICRWRSGSTEWDITGFTLKNQSALLKLVILEKNPKSNFHILIDEIVLIQWELLMFFKK